MSNDAKRMAINTPMLDELETGPWPSFITDLKKYSEKRPVITQLLNQLNDSYETKWNYWQGKIINCSGYGGGIIARVSDKSDIYPDLANFHTVRVIEPPGWVYNTEALRNLADTAERNGAGIIQFHGMSGDILLLGFDDEGALQCCEDVMNDGWDIGGSGAAMRTLQCCVGQARCEMACYDTMKATKHITDTFIEYLHRPEFVYKCKFKLSGCGNDCANAIVRSDLPIIGTWRGPMQIDQAKVTEFINDKGLDYTIENVITRCPTNCITLKTETKQIEVDDANCVHCMHCLNVMHKALKPGLDKGVTILVGGHRTLKIGDTMSSVLVPFMKLETDEDMVKLTDFVDQVWEFWNDNGMDHERIGEFIHRVGMGNFLKGCGIEPDPRMIKQPRTTSYIKFEELGPSMMEGEREQNPPVWNREPESSETM
jgi:sulfite reductase alpha subunit